MHGRAVVRGESVELSDVTKVYDNGVVAVRSLSLSLEPGAFTTILGPSGSGKTSTLMMIAGFEAASSGEIRIAGRNVTNVPAHKRNLGMVFQNYALFPHMSVEDNVGYPLKMRGIDRAQIRRAVADALALVQLEGYEKRRPRQLSGGQQQRVALARATVFQPAVLLMDEPLGALDRKLRQAMQFELKRIHHQLGITVVSVTHDQEEALTMSDRIVLMRDGQIQQSGTPQDIYEAPNAPFVADFIGEANIISGQAVSTDSGTALVVTEHVRFSIPAARAVGATKVAIRPERIKLAPLGSNSANRRAQGVITGFTYAGDVTRVEIELGGGLPLIAKVSNSESAVVPRDGLEVGIEWPDEAVVVLES
jgi:putative spermidine/putrescine transport system ATP-binding protein